MVVEVKENKKMQCFACGFGFESSSPSGVKRVHWYSVYSIYYTLID
jgi:hypothetical protein